MKIVADSAIPFLHGVLEPYAQVEYIAGTDITPDHLRDADALIVRTRTRCDEALLADSHIRMIATATIGFDHIDTTWCKAHGIHVSTAAGCNARGVLQWMGAALAHLSAIQGWQPAERTLGIVGIGNVGSLIREYATAWGFRVLCCDPPREQREHAGFLPLEQVASLADILTFHTPLNTTTHHIADAALFARMQPHAVIINSSRGEVVDGQALLHSQRACMLDVWEHEPHIDEALLHHTLLATPHIAGYSLQGKANATALSVRALSEFFRLPLDEWYPRGVTPARSRAIDWHEMCRTIGAHFDIKTLSLTLKSHRKDFETLRNTYDYRKEYF